MAHEQRQALGRAKQSGMRLLWLYGERRHTARTTAANLNRGRSNAIKSCAFQFKGCVDSLVAVPELVRMGVSPRLIELQGRSEPEVESVEGNM